MSAMKRWVAEAAISSQSSITPTPPEPELLALVMVTVWTMAQVLVSIR